MVETNQNEVIYPTPRSLDSVYVRVERNGKGQTLSFTDLIEPEQQKYLATLDREGLERCVCSWPVLCEVLEICSACLSWEWRKLNARRKIEPG